MTSIVDATGKDGTSTAVVVVQGQAIDLWATLTKDGAVYSLSGKTITATIRREGDPANDVDEDLEGMAVTLGNADTNAAAGGVTLPLTTALTALLTYPGEPVNPWHETAWLVEFTVTDDDFIPDMMRFRVRPGLA
jgi:hypothetical protein